MAHQDECCFQWESCRHCKSRNLFTWSCQILPHNLIVGIWSDLLVFLCYRCWIWLKRHRKLIGHRVRLQLFFGWEPLGSDRKFGSVLGFPRNFEMRQAWSGVEGWCSQRVKQQDAYVQHLPGVDIPSRSVKRDVHGFYWLYYAPRHAYVGEPVNLGHPPNVTCLSTTKLKAKAVGSAASVVLREAKGKMVRGMCLDQSHAAGGLVMMGWSQGCKLAECKLI